jgi:hypothetical protein
VLRRLGARGRCVRARGVRDRHRHWVVAHHCDPLLDPLLVRSPLTLRRHWVIAPLALLPLASRRRRRRRRVRRAARCRRRADLEMTRIYVRMASL